MINNQLEKDRKARYLQIITELNRQNRQGDSEVFDWVENRSEHRL